MRILAVLLFAATAIPSLLGQQDQPPDATTENAVWWDGNRKQSKEQFDNLLADFLAHAGGKTLFVQDLSRHGRSFNFFEPAL